MDTESRDTSRCGENSLPTIHGFRVQSYGRCVSTGFKRALRRLQDRGFDDPTCVVVKTTSGSRSGITHAGGRYVAAEGLYRSEVMREMRELGMEPPSPPFVVTPGEYTLYHEWGHHVDRTWSRDDREVIFSFRWLSRFYALSIVERDVHATDAVVLWWQASSELFADLFEDWMRGEKKVAWNQCEPEHLNRCGPRGNPLATIALLPGVGVEDVRAQTYRLFTAGIRAVARLPPVPPGLFGDNTDEIIGHLRVAQGWEPAISQRTQAAAV
jgi:hypothetical protein